jgi:hypothetical protein
MWLSQWPSGVSVHCYGTLEHMDCFFKSRTLNWYTPSITSEWDQTKWPNPWNRRIKFTVLHSSLKLFIFYVGYYITGIFLFLLNTLTKKHIKIEIITYLCLITRAAKRYHLKNCVAALFSSSLNVHRRPRLFWVSIIKRYYCREPTDWDLVTAPPQWRQYDACVGFWKLLGWTAITEERRDQSTLR